MKYIEQRLVYEPAISYTPTCNMVNVMHVFLSVGFTPCYLVYMVNIQ